MSMAWQQILNTIRTAIYGEEVREGIAQGMEQVKTFRDEAQTAAAAAAAALPLNTALDTAGKAADAKAVGDELKKSLVYRRQLTNADDTHALDDPGTYYIAASNGVPANFVPDFSSGYSRLVVVKSATANQHTAEFQIADVAGDLWFQTSAGGLTWTAWKRVATLDDIDDLFSLIASIISAPHLANTETGKFTFYPNGLNLNTGEAYSSNTRATTAFIELRKPIVKIKNIDPTYSMTVIWTYSSAAENAALRKITRNVDGRAVIIPQSGEKYFRICFKNSLDGTTELDSTDLDALSDAVTVWDFTDKKLETEYAPADAKIVGDAIGAINDRLGYSSDDPTIDVSVNWKIGAISREGTNLASLSRIRTRSHAGKGAVYVLAGSTISCANGFKFNVATYSNYINSADFTLLDYRGPAGGSYTVAQDCYIRVGAGYYDDTPLAEVIDGSVVPISQNVEAVESAITLNFIAPTIKDQLQNLSIEVSNSQRDETLSPCLYSDITTTSDFWNTFDEVSNATSFVTKTFLNDASHLISGYRIPMYTIDCSKSYVGSNYQIQNSSLYTPPRILVIGGVHGDERDSSIGILDAFTKLLANAEENGALSAAVWDVVPIINPYGFDHKQRKNEDGYDINRDYSDWEYTYDGKTYGFKTAEANLIRSLLATNHYDYLLDFHQVGVGSAIYDPANGKYGQLVGMCSTNLKPVGVSEEAYNSILDALYMKFDTANLYMTQACDATYKSAQIPGQKTFFVWDGTSSATLRNYCAGWNDGIKGFNPESATPINPVKSSVCMETSVNCGYYSGSSQYHNAVSRTISSHYFSLAIGEIVKLLE